MRYQPQDQWLTGMLLQQDDHQVVRVLYLQRHLLLQQQPIMLLLYLRQQVV